MSNYWKHTQQYDSKKIDYPETSFKIAGISNYKSVAEDISYSKELTMKAEPTNTYDSTAIRILLDGETVGYVPNSKDYKDLCNARIDEPLNVINIKMIRGNYGVRVIPREFYKEGMEDASIFGDD